MERCKLSYALSNNILVVFTLSITQGLLQEILRRFTPQDKQRSMTSDSIIRMGDRAEDFNSTFSAIASRKHR